MPWWDAYAYASTIQIENGDSLDTRLCDKLKSCLREFFLFQWSLYDRYLLLTLIKLSLFQLELLNKLYSMYLLIGKV